MNIVNVFSDGAYQLTPLGSNSSLPQVIKIDKGDSTQSYYLSYRQNTGLDTGLSTAYTGGVNIHHGRKTDNWSYFVKALNDGGSFSDTGGHHWPGQP